MGLYKREGSDNWYFKFKVNGVPYRGSTGTTRKADAEARMVAERAKVTAPVAAKRQAVTLGDAASGWLADEGSRMADAENNESRVRKLFGEAKGPRGVETGRRFGLSRALHVHQLSNTHLTQLRRARRDEGNSDATINREIALIQAVLRYADKKLRAQMPAEALDFAEYVEKEKRGKLRYYTLEEEVRLLADLEAQGVRAESLQWPPQIKRAIRDQLDLAVFLLDTGGRYGEGAGVPWDVVDFERGEVNLYRDKVGNEGVLGMTDRLRAMLLRRWAERDPGNPWIFPGTGTGKARGYAVKGIRNAMERCGLNAEHLVARFGRATPAHTFRHTFASRLVQAGISLKKVSFLLGHTSVKTTEIYAHLCPSGAAAEAVEALNRIHAPKARAEVVPSVQRRA